MLGRLRITQRLSLLLLLPLGAVVLISVPFTVERVDDARAAAAIVDSAHNARAIGAVIQEVQAERLLALGYLASARLSRSAVVAQVQSTVDAKARALSTLAGPARAALSEALKELDGLVSLRQTVLERQTSVTDVYRVYHESIGRLINAMRLGDQPGADATGVRQMSSLDALLRTNEEASSVGAALVVAAADPAAGRAFGSSAIPLRQVHLENFRQLGDPVHVALLAQGDKGPAAARTAALMAGLTQAGQPARISIDDSLSVAQTGITVQRALQDRITRDIATRASGRAAAAEAAAITVAAFATALLVLVTWLGVAVSRSVARPLRRVTLAATAVADLASREMVRVTDEDAGDERPPRLAALTLHTADEVGELASAFNRVQATAALLMEQQVTTRRNVAVMFGNIAHRTQSLVARQLAHIDHLERNERDEERLTSLYRLDHLTARLRRSADSLLVIAGTRDDARLASPTRLSDVIRSATAEIEGYQDVRLLAIRDATIVASAVPDLTLLLAELLENATAFSPPDVPVEVSASLHRGCLIQIVDRGIGMSPERLAIENRRLVSRERLDVAPTTMLGLFVVGRLARRYGIDVRLLPTPVSGVTAEVVLPTELLMSERPPSLTALELPAVTRELSTEAYKPGRGGPPPLLSPPQLATVADSEPGFQWFDHYRPTPVEPAHAANGSPTAVGGPNRGGLRRRQPGQHLADTELPRSRATETAPVRDPEAERSALNAFADGAARAAESSAGDASATRLGHERGAIGRPPPGPVNRPPDARSGLHRRRPGEHLAEGLRTDMGHHEAQPAQTGGHRSSVSRIRDPDAEREQLSGYLDGLARAADPTNPSRDPWSRT